MSILAFVRVVPVAGVARAVRGALERLRSGLATTAPADRGRARDLRGLRGRAAAAMGAGVVAALAPVWAAGPAVQALPVAPDVWYVQGEAALGSSANRNFISNAAFVVTGQGVLVIDALGSPPLAQELKAAIARITDQPVKWVIVTHCHADHIYGLQVFQDAGAEIWAHPGCRLYLHSDTARLRLQASREELFPFVDEHTRLVAPDHWFALDAQGRMAEQVMTLGGRRFRVQHAGPSHTPEDLLVLDEGSGVLFAGDTVFRGRIPFVGQADSRSWIDALDRMVALRPKVLVPGHGPLSIAPIEDLQLTRDYLVFLRQAMAEAAHNLEPFEEAYARTDWSRFERLPLFRAANRMNAYNTYLLMEREGR